MCYETSARPPLPPIAGGAGEVRTEQHVLEASDGNRFNAFSALTAASDAPGVMILPDVRGLHPFYEDLAVRFAEVGAHATAMDWFGRTAGLEDRDDDFEWMPHVQQMTPDGVGADSAATIAYLRSDAGGGAKRVYSVGFCMGGRISFNQARRDHGLDGVIGFYGGLGGIRPGDPTSPVELAPQYRAPVLGLFGGADPGIPPEDVEAFRKALDGAGVQNEIVVYDGAPHSFFDRSFEEHREACDDAWRRVLAFLSL